MVVSGFACTDASLREESAEGRQRADNLVRIRGEYCTEPSERVQFPVKVLYLLDQSTSLQCTDSNNVRFDALRDSLETLRSQPNTEFAFVGFSSWTKTSVSDEKRFTRDGSDVQDFLDSSQGLGPATDYQGALATGLQILENDMRETSPAERARTRYVVNFISDGVPTPRCNQGCEDDREACQDGIDNDGDGDIDGEDSDCEDIDDNTKHPDNLYGICNTTEEIPDGEYVDFDGACPAYNQPRQVLKRVQDIVELEEQFDVGSIRLNSVLLFSPQSVVDAACPDASTQFGYDREEAESMLQSMAEEGEGAYRDVNLAESDDDFLEFEVASLEAEQTLSAMFARNAHAVATADGPVPDTDSDGLSDAFERGENLDPESRDTDGDLYGDLFEEIHSDDGFDPANESIPASSCQSERDGDGDGLLDCEEAVLETSPTDPDTDADGITDRLELVAGTDPLEADASNDVDFDGVKNIDEIRGGTDPVSADSESFRSSRIRYEIEEEGLREFPDEDLERQCYEYDIRNIELVTTPIPGERGLNRLLIRTSERPAKVAGVSGEIRTACVETIYNDGGVKNPEDGVVEMTSSALEESRASLSDGFAEVTSCERLDGEGTRRGEIESMVEECMSSEIEVDRWLLDRDAVLEMMQRHVESDLGLRMPERPYEFFVPLADFDPQVHCYRPWELDRLESFLERAAAECRSCAGNSSEAGSDADARP